MENWIDGLVRREGVEGDKGWTGKRKRPPVTQCCSCGGWGGTSTDNRVLLLVLPRLTILKCSVSLIS